MTLSEFHHGRLVMTLSEFHQWLDNCERDAKARGLTDEEILLAYLERVRGEIVMRLVKKAQPTVAPKA